MVSSCGVVYRLLNGRVSAANYSHFPPLSVQRMNVSIKSILLVLTLSVRIMAAPTPQPDDGEILYHHTRVCLVNPTDKPDHISCGDASRGRLCRVY